MMAFRADLHTHTYCSDGILSPKELIDLAVNSDLAGLSITDHDTVEAYEDAIPYAKQKGIRLGIGIEFSSVFKEMSVHILGYDFPYDDPRITSFCLNHRKRRKERCLVMLEKLKKHKILLSEEDVMPEKGNVGRLHIARAMVAKAYVPSIKQAFTAYLGDHKACFHRGETVSSEETIELIHQVGGKAFIAHPHLLKNQKKMKALFELPFDGVECFYGRHAALEENRFLTLAHQKKWLVSGGSDFHGDLKHTVSLGASWVDRDTFDAIFQR